MMKLKELPAPEFGLRSSIESGQIFHAMPEGNGWSILVDRTPVHAEMRGDKLLVTEGQERLAAHYFALDHPLPEIYRTFPTDSFSRSALAACRGLRIFRQPRWECLATFITSPMKQVAHIRQISLTLREKYGEPVPGSPLNAYPKPERLAALTEKELRACGLGFRAKNLLGAARSVVSGALDLEAVADLDTISAREALCALSGVGRKVGNCVLLFAYERLDAVPVDVWIARVVRAMRRRKATPLEMERYSGRRFGAYAGYVQQYLFHYARLTKTLPA